MTGGKTLGGVAYIRDARLRGTESTNFVFMFYLCDGGVDV